MDRCKGCTPFIKMYMDAEEAVRTEGRKQNLLRRAVECVGKRDRFSRFFSSDHGPMRLLGNFPFLSEHFSQGRRILNPYETNGKYVTFIALIVIPFDFTKFPLSINCYFLNDTSLNLTECFYEYSFVRS